MGYYNNRQADYSFEVSSGCAMAARPVRIHRIAYEKGRWVDEERCLHPEAVVAVVGNHFGVDYSNRPNIIRMKPEEIKRQR